MIFHHLEYRQETGGLLGRLTQFQQNFLHALSTSQDLPYLPLNNLFEDWRMTD